MNNESTQTPLEVQDNYGILDSEGISYTIPKEIIDKCFQRLEAVIEIEEEMEKVREDLKVEIERIKNDRAT